MVMVLAIVVMITPAAARHLWRFRSLTASAVRPEAAVSRRHGLDRVLDLADLGLAAVGESVVALPLLGPPRHRAGLGGEADRGGLLGALRAGLGGKAGRVVMVVPVRAGVGLVARLGLLAQRQQLLHRLGAGGTCTTE